MNKLTIVVLVAVGVIIALFVINASNHSTTSSEKVANGQITPVPGGDSSTGTSNGQANPGVKNFTGGTTDTSTDDKQGLVDTQDRPATELYRTAEEALNAVKSGAANYDDIVLEQFTDVGPDCSWCDSFYKSVKDLLNGAEIPSDQKSYYAELLAISGRVDNISTLVDAVETAQPGQDTQLQLEALEMTVGKDDVINYLGNKLTSSQNPVLKESLVAAISNQGSPLAVNTLYKATLESGNPDGYYSQGTGLGEVIPDPESFGVLEEIVNKKDDYSHLAVKALLNGGTDGLKAVYDTLNSSNNPEQDRKLLKDAMDHINYDEESETFLKEKMAKSNNPALVELANSAIESFNKDANEDVEADTDAEAIESGAVSTQAE